MEPVAVFSAKLVQRGGAWALPVAVNETSINKPLNAVWLFMKDVNNWAAFFTGYQSHEQLSHDKYVWNIKGEVGIISRLLELEITVTEWNTPRSVVFSMEGIKENVEGRGYLRASPLSEDETELQFELEMLAGGPLGPMINALLPGTLEKTTCEFVTRVKQNLNET